MTPSLSLGAEGLAASWVLALRPDFHKRPSLCRATSPPKTGPLLPGARCSTFPVQHSGLGSGTAAVNPWNLPPRNRVQRRGVSQTRDCVKMQTQM